MGATHAIECVYQTVLNEECPGHDIENGAALTENKQGGAHGGKRSIKHGQHSCLRKVCEEEHAREDTQPKSNCGQQLGCQWLP